MAAHRVAGRVRRRLPDRGDDRLVARLRDAPRQPRAGDDAQHLAELDLDLRLGARPGGGSAEASAMAMWKRASASRKAANRPPRARPRRPSSAMTRARLAVARCGGQRGRLAETARRQSVSSRNSPRVGGSPDEHERAGGSSRTNEPPVRPRRVSTNPASRRICSAWRSVIGATPSCAASSTSLGRRSPGASTPGADRLAEAAHDLLDGALRLQRCERDVAGGDVRAT